MAAQDPVLHGVDSNSGGQAVRDHSLLAVVEFFTHFPKRLLGDQAGEEIRASAQGGAKPLSEAGRLEALAVDARDQGFVDASIDEHVSKVGDAHQFLPFAHRLPLGDDGQLRAAAQPRLVGNVVDDETVLRRDDRAFSDYVFDFLVVGQLLKVDRSLGLLISRRLNLRGLRLLLQPSEGAVRLANFVRRSVMVRFLV